MFPIGGPGPLLGQLTPEMQEKLRKIRFCVIGTFIAAIGRFCTGDIPVSELLSGIVGIFLLNDDPNVAPCYACLASSPLGQCSMGHGVGCALTYGFLAGMNSIFLMLKLFTGPFILVSFCCQACGAFLGMKLNALVSQEQIAQGLIGPGLGPVGPGLGPGLGPGPGGPPGPQTPFFPNQGNQGSQGNEGPSRSPETQPFQAFQGTGMRLGG